MDSVCRDIFKAVHENKWLSIEYLNQNNEVTKYWIGIKMINPQKRTMNVEGLHLLQHTVMNFVIKIDSIIASNIVDGSWYDVPNMLKEDIGLNPVKWANVFGNVSNLQLLNYYSDCNRMDSTPYNTEYALIKYLDADKIKSGNYELSNEQFNEIVKNFQYTSQNQKSARKIKQLALNIISVPTKKGLYVLAYRRLLLDVSLKRLKPDDEISICSEYTIDGSKQSIRRFLDADDFDLLDDIENNLEQIKDCITQASPDIKGVDDMPYVISIGRDIILDLHDEYGAIHKMFEDKSVTAPINAFFGNLVSEPASRKVYPITLINERANMDQLLAIHNAMKYPLAYIQGPPGTGKTNTIVNTIMTAFFNDKTVLFTSYNNHPIDGVCSLLQNLSDGRGKTIPFPIVRLGNDEIIPEALDYIKHLYEETKNLKIFDDTLEKRKSNRIEQTKKLTKLLQTYEEKLQLQEKKEAITRLMESNKHLTFQTQLQGVQLGEVEKRLSEVGEITDEEAMQLIEKNDETFLQYLYYTCAKYIKRLGEPKNKDLLDIIYEAAGDKRTKAFNEYIKKDENLKRFQRIFPIIATTSISSHKIGKPGVLFDMVVMDEASQGNIAVSLVPIIRGENLMLVGDPQQLNPVILLNPMDNEKLKKMYCVSDEYDYVKNSIYKTFLASDAVSREILLSHHYRCHKKIIQFNNKKYYNGKLDIRSKSNSDKPLVYVNVVDNNTGYKNTSPAEAQQIVSYSLNNPRKSIGVITPFVNQKELITSMLKENGVTNVTCGTVHAFQGDEKDVILFSLALTDRTSQGTYEWLKNNKELINVAVSRAKDQLYILSNDKELERLHGDSADDDLYELVHYVRSNGETVVTPKAGVSRALGIKPYSTETEMAFLETLNHALDNVLNTGQRCVVQKEVAISQVFEDNITYSDLFYTGRFDFVVYERDTLSKRDIPILAIELDGKEHQENSVVRERDKKKNQICYEHGLELIRIENTYARRYQYMKEILESYFKNIRRL